VTARRHARRNGPRILDLCCGAGGAALGYYLAGFEVTGVDIAAQPRYPFTFVQADALTFPLDGFDAVHASPPCQAWTLAQRIRRNGHPDLITPVRARVIAAGLPYVIENVPGAPLRDPVTLCGAMFAGLAVYRHREFETSFPLTAPAHPVHTAPLAKMGRPPRPGEFMHVVGNFSGAARARQAMGIGWMTRDELREAIPPAYTRHVGHALAKLLAGRASAGGWVA
jgi:DNA (cytosine-5)-methyltransferase 1